MAYSTLAELRGKLKQLTITMQSDATVTANILEADKEIKTDLAGIIDFDLVPADSTDSTFPIFLNTLSKWKTCEICLVYQYSVKRETTQVDDISYYRDKYDDLIQRIRDGFIILELSDGTSIAGSLGGSSTYTNPKKGISPALGTGDYGNFQDDADKEDDEDRG